jgi:hypothetical protein
MTIIYTLILIGGIGGIFFGFRGLQTLKPPYNTAAAVALPIGLILALFATLMLCVPRFFP